jgi:hypothetical protein
MLKDVDTIHLDLKRVVAGSEEGEEHVLTLVSSSKKTSKSNL